MKTIERHYNSVKVFDSLNSNILIFLKYTLKKSLPPALNKRIHIFKSCWLKKEKCFPASGSFQTFQLQCFDWKVELTLSSFSVPVRAEWIAETIAPRLSNQIEEGASLYTYLYFFSPWWHVNFLIWTLHLPPIVFWGALIGATGTPLEVCMWCAGEGHVIVLGAEGCCLQ